MSDARFEDGGDQPLRLLAMDDDDLRVIATLVQDAVLPASEIKWVRGQRRLALLLNRFRWEHRVAAAPAERVQSLLVIEDVTGVASQGLEPTERDVVLSLLDLRFEAGEDGQGTVLLTFAGDGALRASVECLNIQLRDVTRPVSGALWADAEASRGLGSECGVSGL